MTQEVLALLQERTTMDIESRSSFQKTYKSDVLSLWNAVNAVSLTAIETVDNLQALRTNSFNQNGYCRTHFWLLAVISDTRMNLRALRFF